jgi:WD40 repeat protein
VPAVAFSPDGQTLATADGGGTSYLWSTATHRLIATLAEPKGLPVGGVVFGPNGQSIATADGPISSPGQTSAGTTYLWQTP